MKIFSAFLSAAFCWWFASAHAFPLPPENIRPQTDAPDNSVIEGDYFHSASRLTFPETIDELQLFCIAPLDSLDEEISALYVSPKGTHAIIFLYHGEFPLQSHRLRAEFYTAIHEAQKEWLADSMPPVWPHTHIYENADYSVTGLWALLRFSTIPKNQQELRSVYECGHWLLQIQVSVPEADLVPVERVNEHIVKSLHPTVLVEHTPLTPKFLIRINHRNIPDSTFLVPIWACARAELDWDSTHRSPHAQESGIQDMDYASYITGIHTFLAVCDTMRTKSAFTQQYETELRSILDAGFIGEFVSEQNYIAGIPGMNFPAYIQWKKEHRISIHWDTSKFYWLMYDPAMNRYSQKPEPEEENEPIGEPEALLFSYTNTTPPRPTHR